MLITCLLSHTGQIRIQIALPNSPIVIIKYLNVVSEVSKTVFNPIQAKKKDCVQRICNLFRVLNIIFCPLFPAVLVTVPHPIKTQIFSLIKSKEFCCFGLVCFVDWVFNSSDGLQHSVLQVEIHPYYIKTIPTHGGFLPLKNAIASQMHIEKGCNKQQDLLSRPPVKFWHTSWQLITFWKA